MKIYFAADHAGFEMKHALLNFVRGELGHETEDCGAFELNPADDYPQIIAAAASRLALDASQGKDSRAIILGASGQGEAMAANRFKHVRAAVFYGEPAIQQVDAHGNKLDMVASVRTHNDANALSIAARFVSVEEAKDAVRTWLSTPFSDGDRHRRRIAGLDSIVK